MGTVAKIKADGATHLVASTAYATCATAAATVAKVATIQDSQAFTLMTGVTIHVKFTNSNTATNPTLNVNSTGAKAIKRYGTTAVGTNAQNSWNAGALIAFTYDGTNWLMNDWLNNNTWTANSKANAGYVAAGNGHPNSVWATDGDGDPAWRDFNHYYYKRLDKSITAASTWTAGASVTVPAGIYVISGLWYFGQAATPSATTVCEARIRDVTQGTAPTFDYRRNPNGYATAINMSTVHIVPAGTTSTMRVDGYCNQTTNECETVIAAVRLSEFHTGDYS